MHNLIHARRHGSTKVFEGRSTRIYDVAARSLLRRFYRKVAVDVARLAPPGAAVLDVGTGPGVLLMELARRRPDLRLTGIDVSADMVARATRNLARFGDRATAQVADVAALPFPDGSFDLIVSSLSVHHWPDPAAAVPQLARVLRPAGRVVIYDFPSSPLDTLADTAKARGVLSGQPPERTPFRTGMMFLRCVRYILSG
jgi:ubiquinone/menaquinone biosynthesis C-methylase UbiE